MKAILESELEGRLCFCEECQMWIDFEISGLTVSFKDVSKKDFVFVCERCSRLVVLEARLAEMQVRMLDAVKVHGDVVQASEKCGVEVQEREDTVQGGELEWQIVDEWRMVDPRGAGTGEVSEFFEAEVATSNSFELLQEVDVGVEPTVDREDLDEVQAREGCRYRDKGRGRRFDWGKEKVKDSVLLVGDSIVRYVDREFSKGNKDKRTSVCFPGARIEDVSKRVNFVVDTEEVVVVQVGTNNLGHDSSGEMKSKYRELLCRLKASRAKVVCCGLLPRYDRKGFVTKIEDFNEWLARVCDGEEMVFLDSSQFQNRRDLFGRDGLHLSRTGAYEFGKAINKVVESFFLN